MHLVCWQCSSVNRVPDQRLRDKPICGKCGQALLPSHPVDLSDDNFDKFVQRTEIPVLVDFWAPWCGPCRIMAPDFAKAAQQCWPEVLFAKLNTETDPRTAQQYEISGIPTLMLFRHGQLVASQSGAIGSAQIAAFARAG